MHIGSNSIDIDIDKAKLKNLNEVLASIAAEREKLRVELNSAPRIILYQKAEEPKEEYRRAMRLAVIGLAGAVRLLPAAVRHRRCGTCGRGASMPSPRSPAAWGCR